MVNITQEHNALTAKRTSNSKKRTVGETEWIQNSDTKKIKTGFETKDSEIKDLREKLQKAIQTMEENDKLMKQKEKMIQSLKVELQSEKEKNTENFDTYVQRVGGLSRHTITSDIYHETNPTAAHMLFGFKNWKQTKIMLQTLFKDMQLGKRPSRKHLINNNSINDFEKCLIALMRIRCR